MRDCKTERSSSIDESIRRLRLPSGKLSTFIEVVEAAKIINLEAFQGNRNDDRPKTCIPIIQAYHTTEPDKYSRVNREPKQTRYKDEVTGQPLKGSKRRMHYLSVPSRGNSKATEARRPEGFVGSRPASGKQMGVKKIQYLIDKRQKRLRKREERRKSKSKHKWIEADRLRIAHKAAMEDKKSTLAWT